MDEIKKIPPVTRTIIFATALVTLGPLLKIVNAYHFLLWWPAVWKGWEIWRPFTCFFLGSGDLQLLFEIFMLLRNSTDLEVNFFYRKTSEYTWALLIINSLILALNYPLESVVLYSPFIMAITYLWARANSSASVSFFGLINCPAPYLPYAYLLLDLLKGGMPLAIQSSTGLASAYIYYFLREILPASNGGRGARLLPSTPSFLRSLLPDSPDPTTQGQAPPPGGSVRSTGWGGTAFAPAGRSWGDTPPATGNHQTGGHRLNSGGSGPGLTGTLRSWLPFSAGGGVGADRTASSSGTAGPRRGTGPHREAMLAAAEARLRALRENSIAGRNEAASRLASQAAQSPEAQARQQRAKAAAATTATPTILPQGAESSSTGVRRQDGSAQTRRAATASGASTSRQFTFGQYSGERDKGESAGKAKAEDDEENLTASGSGGRVAEIRRGAASPPSDKKDETSEAQTEHSWGTGRKLGE